MKRTTTMVVVTIVALTGSDVTPEMVNFKGHRGNNSIQEMRNFNLHNDTIDSLKKKKH